MAFLAKYPQAKLFPARWGFSRKAGKHTHVPLVKWSTKSSSDPGTIRGWLEDDPDIYACVALGQSGLFVLDADSKGEKRGPEELLALELEHGDLPETLLVATPSGDGSHRYFLGECQTGANRFAPGLDSAVMVPVPGSNAVGKGRYRIVQDLPIAEAPTWLRDLAGRRVEKSAAPAVGDDKPHNVEQAIRYLVDRAPEAIEGQGGDATAYKVACIVRDYGISETLCGELLLEHYAEKCLPFDADWLLSKVESAYRYATGAAGKNTPEAAFADVEIERPRQIARRLVPGEMDFTNMKPREWILGTRYIKEFTTLTVAPGGGSKSTLVMEELLSVALNMELTGMRVHRPGAVWIMNSEDPEAELERRIKAVFDHFKIPIPAEGYPNIHASGSEFEFHLAGLDNKGRLVIYEEHVAEIEEYIRENNIILWSLDPWVRVHQANENDNAAMDRLMSIVAGICRRTGSACAIVHHTRKGADVQGNADAVRGASALVSAARIADTVTVMSEKEAKKLGVPIPRREFYVRLDGAKANLRPPASDTNWFLRVDVRLATGDHIGVLEPTRLEPIEEEAELDKTIAQLLALEIPVGTRVSVNAAATLLVEKHGKKMIDEKGKQLAARTVAGYLPDIFKAPVEVGQVSIVFVVEKTRGTNASKFLSVSAAKNGDDNVL